MAYDASTRKWGSGYTKWLAHSGNTAPYYGERDLATMLSAATDLGATTEGAEFTVEPELVEDVIAQELFPIQIGVAGAKAIFKCTMSVGDAQKLAIAAGYSTTGSTTTTGTAAYTVTMGVLKPVWLTLLHIVTNPHDASLKDYLYIPRAQVNPKITIKTDPKGMRVAEVEFLCAPSQQDGSTGTPTSEDLRIKDASGNPTGMGAPALAIYEHA